MVIISAERGSNAKLAQPRNREWVTVIQGVSSEGPLKQAYGRQIEKKGRYKPCQQGGLLSYVLDSVPEIDNGKKHPGRFLRSSSRPSRPRKCDISIRCEAMYANTG
jgi:hypothetical protein